MRVIAGLAKGTRLYAVESNTTRPVLDRVKESLFNIIAEDVVDANVIDLFAGTGGLGIEALSRGAASCLFVDSGVEQVAVIEKNLEKTQLLTRSRIVRGDVFTLDKNPELTMYCGMSAAGRVGKEGRSGAASVNMILVGAPYYVVKQHQTRDLLFGLFKRFVDKQVILSDGIVVLQHGKGELDIPKDRYDIEMYDTRIYGKTQLTFFRPAAKLFVVNS